MRASIQCSTHAAHFARRLARSAWVALLFVTVVTGGDAADLEKEYKIKAAFLYNFAKFVEWPAERFASETAPIVIGVLGDNQFGTELENIVQDRKANGRDVLVVRMRSIAEATGVHILFISAGEVRRYAGSEAVNQPGVLTVGDSDAFEKAGGVVTFTTPDDKVRFKINMDAANCSGLRISAQLQKLAMAVRKKS